MMSTDPKIVDKTVNNTAEGRIGGDPPNVVHNPIGDPKQSIHNKNPLTPDTSKAAPAHVPANKVPNSAQLATDPNQSTELTDEQQEEKHRMEKEERRTKEREGVRKKVEDAAAAHASLEQKFKQEDEDDRQKKAEADRKRAEAEYRK